MLLINHKWNYDRYKLLLPLLLLKLLCLLLLLLQMVMLLLPSAPDDFQTRVGHPNCAVLYWWCGTMLGWMMHCDPCAAGVATGLQCKLYSLLFHNVGLDDAL